MRLGACMKVLLVILKIPVQLFIFLILNLVKLISPDTAYKMISFAHEGDTSQLWKDMSKFRENQDFAFIFSMDRVKVKLFQVYGVDFRLVESDKESNQRYYQESTSWLCCSKPNPHGSLHKSIHTSPILR